MVEEGAEKHALANTPVSFNPEVIQYTEEYRHYMDIYWMKLGVFKSGASFVTGILMPEIERVENNCDTLENKAVFWMETNDRAIEHTESLQLTITTLKTEIQSLKDERDSAIKAMDYHINSDMRTQEENQSLKDENGIMLHHLKELTKPEPDGFGSFVSEEFETNAVLDARKYLVSKALTKKAEE